MPIHVSPLLTKNENSLTVNQFLFSVDAKLQAPSTKHENLFTPNKFWFLVHAQPQEPAIVKK